MAVGKGHHYWHMVHALDGSNGPELLYIGEGRKEEDLKKFWKWFGKRRAKKICFAVMDMWKGFKRSFKEHCPSVRIIYDKFHIVRHLLNALNEVRKQELRRRSKRMRGLDLRQEIHITQPYGEPQRRCQDNIEISSKDKQKAL